PGLRVVSARVNVEPITGAPEADQLAHQAFERAHWENLGCRALPFSNIEDVRSDPFVPEDRMQVLHVDCDAAIGRWVIPQEDDFFPRIQCAPSSGELLICRA